MHHRKEAAATTLSWLVYPRNKLPTTCRRGCPYSGSPTAELVSMSHDDAHNVVRCWLETDPLALRTPSTRSRALEHYPWSRIPIRMLQARTAAALVAYGVDLAATDYEWPALADALDLIHKHLLSQSPLPDDVAYVVCGYLLQPAVFAGVLRPTWWNALQEAARQVIMCGMCRFCGNSTGRSVSVVPRCKPPRHNLVGGCCAVDEQPYVWMLGWLRSA